jgi:hypothetical protein
MWAEDEIIWAEDAAGWRDDVFRPAEHERWVEAIVSALDVSRAGSVQEGLGRASDRAIQLFDN